MAEKVGREIEQPKQNHSDSGTLYRLQTVKTIVFNEMHNLSFFSLLFSISF